MKLKLNLQPELGKKVEINGSTLTVPLHVPIIELYEDVTLYEPDEDWHVVSIQYHYSEEHYCGVYFYFKDSEKAIDALEVISSTFEQKNHELSLHDVKVIEVENYNELALPRHKVTSINLVKKTKRYLTNPFDQSAVA